MQEKQIIYKLALKQRVDSLIKEISVLEKDYYKYIQ